MAISLAQLIENRKAEKAEKQLKKEVTLSTGEVVEIIKLPEKTFLMLMDKNKSAFDENSEQTFSGNIEASSMFIYEALRLDGGLSLKSKEVQQALGISSKNKDLIYDVVKAAIPNITDRVNLSKEILEFADMNINTVVEDKKK